MRTNKLHTLYLIVSIVWLTGCESPTHDHQTDSHAHDAGLSEPEPPKGPNGGRLFTDGSFTLELAIVETGVPPEYRAWVTDAGAPLSLNDVELNVTLTRLGGVVDRISFAPQGEFLRGDTVIYEPHSFVVSIEARYQGQSYGWEYDSFEGRTRIEPEIAAAFGLGIATAGPAVIEQTVTVYGRIVPTTAGQRSVSARFDGAIRSMRASVGDTVSAGQPLAVIESNESLNTYTIAAPIAGVVTARNGNPGEQTRGRSLFTIMDHSAVWAELSVFPADRPWVKEGAGVTVTATDGAVVAEGKISQIGIVAGPNQAVLARVELDNPDGSLVPGMYVTGKVQVAQHSVPLAVKRSGLQSFRDFTVVYAQIDDEYEVRMLDLGRQDGEWVEVLGGLDPGTRYVAENSYLVKADIEKSGATHDH